MRLYALVFFLHSACGHTSIYTSRCFLSVVSFTQSVRTCFNIHLGSGSPGTQSAGKISEKYFLWGLYSEEELVLTLKTKAFLF